MEPPSWDDDPSSGLIGSRKSGLVMLFESQK